jgi:hydrogenase maturation factor
MENGIIDRFEGDIAVIEIGGVTRDLPRASLPRDAKVGDTLIMDNGEIRLNTAETTKRKKEIQDLMDELFE